MRVMLLVLVLIETLWNVKQKCRKGIETLWNVKVVYINVLDPEKQV